MKKLIALKRIKAEGQQGDHRQTETGPHAKRANRRHRRQAEGRKSYKGRESTPPDGPFFLLERLVEGRFRGPLTP